MAKRTITLSADTTGTYLASIHRRRDSNHWTGTILVYGGGGNNFGGGTVTLYLSPDGGTTLLPMSDMTYTALSTGTNIVWGNIEIGNGSTNSDALKIYVVLTGSTSPTIKIDLFDNN